VLRLRQGMIAAALTVRRQPSFAVFASDAEWVSAALAIIWNVQRVGCVTTLSNLGKPARRAAVTQQMRS
jgi:hypothetical protein